MCCLFMVTFSSLLKEKGLLGQTVNDDDCFFFFLSLQC